MRGRRTVAVRLVERLNGSVQAKERLKVLLTNLNGTCRVKDACAQMGIGQARFYQLREQMLTGALAGLEAQPAGRPAQTPTPEQAEREALRHEVAQLKIELQAARVQAEVAVALPRVQPQPAEREKKSPGRRQA
jgi:transposase-like protein